VDQETNRYGALSADAKVVHASRSGHWASLSWSVVRRTRMAYMSNLAAMSGGSFSPELKRGILMASDQLT
jgi:hypothetical protein